MLPPAVAEQQAKLGVSAEESKAQRIKRQQARFRDRGGAFVPSTSNPLVDILLARTVSGESPSKARQASPTRKAGVECVIEQRQPVAGSSKSKRPAPRKSRVKAVEPQDDPVPKPAPKRRRTVKREQKPPDPDTEQPPPETKSKPTSKRKGKLRTAPSTSDGNPKTKAKAKSNPPKEVVEVLVSDDDQTLVDVPHKTKANPKRNIRSEDDGKIDDDEAIVRKRVRPHGDDPKVSGTKTATRVKTERNAEAGSSGRKVAEDGEERTQDEKQARTNAKKRLVSRDDDDIPAPPPKKGRVANSTPVKPKIATEPEPSTKNIKNGANAKVAGKGKAKGRVQPAQDIVEPVGDDDDDDGPPERVSKPKKRKKEEDNYDDRPRKAVKFFVPGPPHSSSRELKENQSDRKRGRAAKTSSEHEPDAPRSKLATNPPPRAKTPKGPPREVLERIKASAARHLKCLDSEPDELDCLS
ncbi:hypothetical protein HD554DRAFT_878316 [Boletus coccyginus]|nr:hypothetical protein HD554DRAFT_878316 [Boletus coccyginus]